MAAAVWVDEDRRFPSLKGRMIITTRSSMSRGGCLLGRGLEITMACIGR
jgi:hypothetical protein